MDKKDVLFFLVMILLLPCYSYSTEGKESFIDPQKYLQTNVLNKEVPQQKQAERVKISTSVSDDLESEKRRQQALDFVELKEQRNEKIRQEKAEITSDNFDNTDDFISPTHKFVPIDAIVLDAGHGGKDSGAIRNGIEEKRLALTLVKKLHALFRKKKIERYKYMLQEKMILLYL